MMLSPLYSSSAYGITSQDNLSLLIDLDSSSLGSTPKLVVKAVRHLCGLTLPDEDIKPIPFDDYYETAREYYDEIKMSDKTGRNLLIFLSYVSTYFHEIRHVHDLLSTAYGQDILFQNFNLYQNAPSLAVALEDWQSQNPQHLIPLPILGNMDLLPGLPEDTLRLISRYSTLAEQINDTVRPRREFYSNLAVLHLLECSATVAQLQFVGDVFGHDAVLNLIKYIQMGDSIGDEENYGRYKKGDPLKFYLHIIGEMLEIFTAKGFQGENAGTAISYICWCSLLGTTLQDKKRNDGVSPLPLYEALVEYVARKTESMDFFHIQELIDDFCKKWGFLTPVQMISRISRERGELINKLEQNWKPHGDLGTILIDHYKGIVKGYNGLIETIMKDPQSYFQHYAWAVMYGRLPSIRVLVKTEDSTLTFMTAGYEILSPDEWETLAQLSITLQLLLEGRNLNSSFSFIEQVCYERLVKQNHLRFKDIDFNF